MPVKSLCVMVSGGGSNLQSVMDAIARGEIKARIALVLSSREDAYALTRAKNAGIPTRVVAPSSYGSREAFDQAVLEALEASGADYIILAGYLCLLGGNIIGKFKNRIINIHPALIPAFCGKGYYGEKVHKAVLEYGAKVSGATVHFVDEGTDTGPIILQTCVPVLDEDDEHTLAARVLEKEHELLPKAVKLLTEGKLRIEGRRVRITG
ncbi:MAG: phosphoribosylglycinamide formyltransferase [Bacillota bacterium]|nr:phosphoribosylglycinamide formyltransferase [Bacillota bacterium]